VAILLWVGIRHAGIQSGSLGPVPRTLLAVYASSHTEPHEVLGLDELETLRLIPGLGFL